MLSHTQYHHGILNISVVHDVVHKTHQWLPYSSPAVPSGTVTNVGAEVVDGGLHVTFDPITDPNAARGNVSYMVCYTTETNAIMVCETTQVSPTIISVPGNEVYNVTVTPFTVAGLGMTSAGVVAGKMLEHESMFSQSDVTGCTMCSQSDW